MSSMRIYLSLVKWAIILAFSCSDAVQPTPRPAKLDGNDATTEWCPAWKNIICGSDGRNYWNECLFKHAQNQTKELTQIQAGVCEEPDCLECKSSSNLKLYRVCASNNKRLPDYCSIKCHVEEFPLISEDYKGCTTTYPPAEEVEEANSDFFLRMMEQLLLQTMTNMELNNRSIKLELDNFQGLLSSKNMTFKTVARQGWMKEIKTINARDGFSISASTPGRLLFELNTEGVSIGYDKILVSSGATKARTSLQMNIKTISLELIGEVQAPEADCTRFQPKSLRIQQLQDVDMETSAPLPTDFPLLQLQGFIKERFFSNLNKGLITLMLPEMFRIGCLSWAGAGPSKCFGAFQTRFCSFGELRSSNPSPTSTAAPATSVPPEESTTPAPI